MFQRTLLLTFDIGPKIVATKLVLRLSLSDQELNAQPFCGMVIHGLAQKEEEGKGYQRQQATMQDGYVGTVML